MKNLPYILFALAALCMSLSGCYYYKDPEPKAVAADNDLPRHESWCYHTLGETDCYTHPQNTVPDRLVNVDPQSRYPLTPEDHVKAVGAVGADPVGISNAIGAPGAVSNPEPASPANPPPAMGMSPVGSGTMPQN